MLGVVLPLMTLMSSGMLLVAIPLALIAIDPVVALAASLALGASYGVISWLSRRRLYHNSRRQADAQTEVLKALQEGLGGIRDVLLDGAQPVFCEVYRQADEQLRRAQGSNVFIAQSPRFAMEAVGMVLIAVLAYSLTRQGHGAGAALPILGALALGAQRLLPALQQAFGAWANIAGSRAYLADTVELIDQPVSEEVRRPAPVPLRFQQSIQFRNVRFRYSPDGPWVLDGLSFVIPSGARIGLVGGTGSGKSTTLDLLMGLLQPSEGDILVDGATISWHAGAQLAAHHRARTTEHLPGRHQRGGEHCLRRAVRCHRHVARARGGAARADRGVHRERPEGYEALVGERGVRLSGGQRQRIGIARALYKHASVLVLDEATSALDNATERSVMEAIEALDRELTILLIAHRLTTVRRCDTIIELGARPRRGAGALRRAARVQPELPPGRSGAAGSPDTIGSASTVFNDKSILITGGTGSFGRQFVRAHPASGTSRAG